MTDGKVTVEIIEQPSILQVNEDIVTLLIDEKIVTLNIGTTGPQGPRGTSVLSGSGEPSLSLGIVGDFYINTDTQEMYGPKTAISWGIPVDLVTNQELGYVHIQSSPSSIWNISHNLGFIPNITVVNSFEEVVEGSYEYTSENTIRLTFDGPFSGKAYLS
jgi:hypothetical protein